jgi:hypothetical protein
MVVAGRAEPANPELRALVAQARELLFERQVEQALAVSDRLLRLVEPSADPGSSEVAALLEHARSAGKDSSARGARDPSPPATLHELKLQPMI